MKRVWLRTLNIAQFLDRVMLSLENTASSNVPNNLFVKRLIVKNSSLYCADILFKAKCKVNHLDWEDLTLLIKHRTTCRPKKKTYTFIYRYTLNIIYFLESLTAILVGTSHAFLFFYYYDSNNNIFFKIF